MTKKKVQFMQEVKDDKGFSHTVIIYGKGDLCWGNKSFKTMKEVKEAINGRGEKMELTKRSKELFLEYAKDADNWAGHPLVGGNVDCTKEDRGNLSDLVQKGLIEINDDGEGCTWIYFTDEGKKLALENGITIEDDIFS